MALMNLGNVHNIRDTIFSPSEQGLTGRGFLLRDGSGRVLAKKIGYRDGSGRVVRRF